MSTRRRSARPDPETPIEWIGGTSSTPTWIDHEGGPYRPEGLYWMSAEGAVLGLTMARPGELLAMAGESLQRTIEAPMFGRPHRPTRLRVASAELAAVLRAEHPGLEVVCAPTPELDAMLALMHEQLSEIGEDAVSYLAPGVTPEAMGAFFEAAAALYRAAPWAVVPGDDGLFSVTVEALGVRDAVLSVIGQLGQSLGLILFANLDDFEAWVRAAGAMERGKRPELPRHLVLHYERGAELPPELRWEISEHRWEVAGPSAHPALLLLEQDAVARPAIGTELVLAEAIARALTGLMAEREALQAAWAGGEPVRRTWPVRTHAGELEVSLCTPYPRAGIELDPRLDLLAELAALARQDGEIDHERRHALEDVLVRRFRASPEARGLQAPHACRIVMELAAHHLGHTIATLGAPELRTVLFELIPGDEGLEVSAARPIVEGLRGFYRFSKRALGFEAADACLRVLGGSAVKRLEAKLSERADEPGLFESLLAAGAEAGFDMESREGVEAWLRTLQGKPLPPSVRLPGPPPASRPKKPAAKAQKRPARKAPKKPAPKAPGGRGRTK